MLTVQLNREHVQLCGRVLLEQLWWEWVHRSSERRRGTIGGTLAGSQLLWPRLCGCPTPEGGEEAEEGTPWWVPESGLILGRRLTTARMV
jgi:hypothetical protein